MSFFRIPAPELPILNLPLFNMFIAICKMSHIMRKPTICICENKDADQLRSNHEADQHLCFGYKNSTIPLYSKSEISSLGHFLCSYSSVCVRPVQKAHCLFSHDAAQKSYNIPTIHASIPCVFLFFSFFFFFFFWSHILFAVVHRQNY